MHRIVALRHRRLGLVAAPALAGALLAAVDPDAAGNSVCFFRLSTGVACPGCGLTRGIAALLRADFSVSWSLHPLAWPAALQLTIAWLIWFTRRRLSPRVLTAVLLADLVLVVAVWGVRLGTGTLPPV